MIAASALTVIDDAGRIKGAESRSGCGVESSAGQTSAYKNSIITRTPVRVLALTVSAVVVAAVVTDKSAAATSRLVKPIVVTRPNSDVGRAIPETNSQS